MRPWYRELSPPPPPFLFVVIFKKIELRFGNFISLDRPRSCRITKGIILAHGHLPRKCFANGSREINKERGLPLAPFPLRGTRGGGSFWREDSGAFSIAASPQPQGCQDASGPQMGALLYTEASRKGALVSAPRAKSEEGRCAGGEDREGLPCGAQMRGTLVTRSPIPTPTAPPRASPTDSPLSPAPGLTTSPSTRARQSHRDAWMLAFQICLPLAKERVRKHGPFPPALCCQRSFCQTHEENQSPGCGPCDPCHSLSSTHSGLRHAHHTHSRPRPFALLIFSALNVPLPDVPLSPG